MSRPTKRRRSDTNAAVEEFRRSHIALIQNAALNIKFGAGFLSSLFREHSDTIEKTWCFESGVEPTVKTCLEELDLRFYASCILSKGEALDKLLRTMPFKTPECLSGDDVRHVERAWIFVGRNLQSSLKGRGEHTDAVEVAGTWHLQLQGSKTWSVRPCLDASGAPWNGNPAALPEPRTIRCNQGDVLIINTRTWWHATELPTQEPGEGMDSGLSISVARDFEWGDDINGPSDQGEDDSAPVATNIDAIYASKNLKAGEVAVRESDLPDCSLARSDNPNCEVVYDFEGTDEAAVLALRDIPTGECFSVAPSSSEDEGGGDCSGAESDEGDEGEGLS